jgi:ATP-dependent Lhr-like helicase
MNTTASDDPLDLFLPPVRDWFRGEVGTPTAPQRQGWPAIAAGRHTLILAPTGSGKTLAAFLACLDQLWRQPAHGSAGASPSRGVRVLYVSPLKALNNDIHRNLQCPLEGVAATARRTGFVLPTLEAAVRTGDTSTAERQRLIRHPPHILITTPESLHLLLTSRARETLRHVSHVIVDEIHAVCAIKRGVFLSLLLERLEAIQRPNPDGSPRSFVRIGLSATQRPLDEVARYLGGAAPGADGRLVPRPVTIIDAGIRKNLDLQIVNPVEQFGPLPEKSVWPSIYRLLADQIRAHRSTLIFTNDRRSAERITSFLNEEGELARAHHGSVALEVRQEIESALKEGRLPAVVATASLEMGIDMGAVDLVCQVASPGNVARSLQRVGRAGHLVGQESKGRLIPRTAADLLEQAVLTREMAAGRVEAVRVPINCLDVLAQQIVSLVSMDEWSVADLYSLVRRAYPFRDLSPQAFEATLEMVTGRYRLAGGEQDRPARHTLEALQPRISWDRVHNRLVALPGSQHVALINGGTIPDTGQYAAYAASGVRIGELDEEFIYERRVGDTFLLGTNAWRLERIEADRVIVAPTEGVPAILPFWRGEGIGRSPDLGQALGAFLRSISCQFSVVSSQSEKKEQESESGCLLRTDNCQLTTDNLRDWLQRECFLDRNAARNLSHHLSRQFLAAGCLPSDRTLYIEASRDQLGDWQVLLLSPFGQRLHLGLRLALEARLRRRLGYQPQCLHHDDGILIRLTDMDEPLVDLLEGLTPDNIEQLILDELADSALFALRFRQNAARALLLPRGQAGRRAPLWLQRLRGRDLLQVCRRHPDFPVVVETFRECLHDHLDLPRLVQLLADIRSGAVEVVTRRAEVPSPFAAGLLFSFTAAYLYQLDQVEGEPGKANLDRDLLEQLVSPGSQAHLLDPRAVHQVERRLRGLGHPPRTPAEMAEWLRRLGDLAPSDLEGPMAGFLAHLESDGRARQITLPGSVREPVRWIASEEMDLYRAAFGLAWEGEAPAEPCVPDPTRAQEAGALIFDRFLQTHALVGLPDVLARYPFEPGWAERQLEEWVRGGRVVPVPGGEGEPLQWSAPENLDQVQRGSLSLSRREVITCPAPQFSDFQLRWQGAHPGEHKGGSEGLAAVLARLEGLALPVELWEQTILPMRVPGYQPRWLDEWVAGGRGVWVGQGGEQGAGQLAFLSRDTLARLAAPAVSEAPPLEEGAEKIAAALGRRGACFAGDLALETGLPPSQVRSALWQLVRRGLATNDQYGVARRGETEPLSEGGNSGRGAGPGKALSLRSLRRPMGQHPEGRWSLVPWGRPGVEELALVQCGLLLERYGVVARELALLDSWALPWRVLYEVLSRLELAGEVRRGYFVEGLSGAQFALPDAVRALQDTHLPSTAAAPAVLLHSQDPANLYGSGAPFDIPLLDGGTRPLLRRAGNWLVQKAGRPILLVEQSGKKLTALSSASREDVAAAVGVLGGILDRSGGLAVRHKVTVEEWNGQPVTTSAGRELLEAGGFVRDYQGMTLYAVWR